MSGRKHTPTRSGRLLQCDVSRNKISGQEIWSLRWEFLVSVLPASMFNIRKGTRKFPSKPKLLSEQPVFEPKRSNEVPAIYPKDVRYPDSNNPEMFTHIHTPNKTRTAPASWSRRILRVVKWEVGRLNRWDLLLMDRAPSGSGMAGRG